MSPPLAVVPISFAERIDAALRATVARQRAERRRATPRDLTTHPLTDEEVARVYAKVKRRDHVTPSRVEIWIILDNSPANDAYVASLLTEL